MFSEKQKLVININDEPSELNLERAFAGQVGTLNLGKKGVRLWCPGDDIPEGSEIVFDIRRRPLSEKDVDIFKAACKGRFMTSYIALMESVNPDRIEKMLEHYDYVLVPNKKIKNTPADFRQRILSYNPHK
jgi:hypothetical protein